MIIIFGRVFFVGNEHEYLTKNERLKLLFKRPGIKRSIPWVLKKTGIKNRNAIFGQVSKIKDMRFRVGKNILERCD